MPPKRQPDKTNIDRIISEGAFVLDPKNYSVIDGDTIGVKPPRMAKGVEESRTEWTARRLSIRLYSINASEKMRYNSLENRLRKIGHDIHQDSLGRIATEAARRLMASRALLIEPARDLRYGYFDRYGRLLAHVTVSGCDGPDFVPEGSFSLEWALFDLKLAQPLNGKQMPQRVSDLVTKLLETTTSALPGWG